jgi:hypothetical protein
MKYYLIQRQSGGFDYTIDCGVRVTQLSSETLESAKEEADEKVGNNWHNSKHDYAIALAELLEVSKTVDLFEFLNQRKIEREAKAKAAAEDEQRKKDEAEFARLQQKLGRSA